jgi:hypothetical protein
MAQRETEAATKGGMQTGQDPIILAAAGSVLLAWFQYYVRGNKEHGLFIGLWPPTLLAFSNAIRISEISQKVEGSALGLIDRLMEGR